MPATAGTIAGARLVATSAGAAFGPARSAPGVSKLVCDGACGDAGCRQDIDQRGAEFDQQYGSIVAARTLGFGATTYALTLKSGRDELPG